MYFFPNSFIAHSCVTLTATKICYLYYLLQLESCGVNNTKTSQKKYISLEDPTILPNETCEIFWIREVQGIKKVRLNDYPLANVICTGNYRKFNHEIFDYSESTGYVS